MLTNSVAPNPKGKRRLLVGIGVGGRCVLGGYGTDLRAEKKNRGAETQDESENGEE